MAASGLRAIRYAQEVEGIGVVVANDSSEEAVESIRRNAEANGASCASIVVPHRDDVRFVCMMHEGLFDVVDLDPYGSPTQLLDSAVQAAADGGLLCVTATDMAVLCGNNAEACHMKYNAFPARAKYCHEQALRIVLAAIEHSANRYKRHIVPMLSCSIDFYVRVFVRIYTSAAECKNTPTKMSCVYQCAGCESFKLQPLGRVQTKNNVARVVPGHAPAVPSDRCEDCGWRWMMTGPIWSGPLHDMGWVRDIKKSVEEQWERYQGYDKIHALLTNVSEELEDVPLYYSTHALAHTLKASPPPDTLIRSAILNAGYRVSGSHASPLALKTDAPSQLMWDVMRCWVEEHPVNSDPNTPGEAILQKPVTTRASFARASGAISRSKMDGVARFPLNPEGFWGPKAKAGRVVEKMHDSMKAKVMDPGLHLPEKRPAPPAGAAAAADAPDAKKPKE